MKKKFEHQERRGLPGGPNEMFTYTTGVFSTNIFSTEGYKRNSPDVNNPYNIIPSGNITMEDVDFPVHGVDNLGNEQMMIPGNDYQFPGDMVFETPIAQKGYEVPKRQGVRKNPDGTESTHLMATETLDGKNWFSFPTLFQDPDGTWVDMSEQAKKDWKPVYEEAKRRGEVINFGTDKETAIKFGKGSWKPKMKRGGGLLTKTMKCNSCGWSWKAADGGNDVTTCHKCGGEALPKAQRGGDGDKKIVYVSDKNDPEYLKYVAHNKLYRKLKDHNRAAQKKDAEYNVSYANKWLPVYTEWLKDYKEDDEDFIWHKEKIDELKGVLAVNGIDPNYLTDSKHSLDNEDYYNISDEDQASWDKAKELGLNVKWHFVGTDSRYKNPIVKRPQQIYIVDPSKVEKEIAPEQIVTPEAPIQTQEVQQNKKDQVQYNQVITGYKQVFNPETSRYEKVPVYGEQGYRARGSNIGKNTTTQNNFKYGGNLFKAQEGDETKPWEPKPSIDPAMYVAAAKQFAANERKKQLTGEALKANKNNPQFQAIQQRDKDIETLKGSGVNPARLYMKSDDQGSIDQYVEPEFEEQALNYLANPMTTLGYLARGEDLPNFVPDKGNVIDNAMDVINPFAYLDYADKAYDNLSNDEYAQAGFNLLAAIPFLPKGGKAFAFKEPFVENTKLLLKGGLKREIKELEKQISKKNETLVKLYSPHLEEYQFRIDYPELYSKKSEAFKKAAEVKNYYRQNSPYAKEAIKQLDYLKKRKEHVEEKLNKIQQFELMDNSLRVKNTSPLLDLNTGQGSILNFKTGEKVKSEVYTPFEAVNFSLKNKNKIEKFNTAQPKHIDENYLNTVRDNISFIENVIPGSFVFGSSKLLTSAKLPHLIGDFDIMMSKSNYKKFAKNNPGLFNGSSMKHKIPGAASNVDPIDVVIIDEYKGKAKGERATELFRQFDPDNYYKEVQNSLKNKTNIEIPYSADELLNKVDFEIKSVMDAYESVKDKHINRIDALINYGDPDVVLKGQKQYVKSLLGNDGITGHKFSESSFSNINDNIKTLEKINFIGDKKMVAKNPKKMQLAINDYFINNTILTRYVRGNNLKNIESALKEYKPNYGGGAALGIGQNHVTLGDSHFMGNVFGIKQIKLNNLNTQTPLDYVSSIEDQISGSKLFTKDEKTKLDKILNNYKINGDINISPANMTDLIKLLPYSNKGKKVLYDFAKATNRSMLRTPENYGNSNFAVTLRDFDEQFDKLKYIAAENVKFSIKSKKLRLDKNERELQQLNIPNDLNNYNISLPSEYLEYEDVLKKGLQKLKNKLIKDKQEYDNIEKSLEEKFNKYTNKKIPYLKEIQKEIDQILLDRKNKFYDVRKKVIALVEREGELKQFKQKTEMALAVIAASGIVTGLTTALVMGADDKKDIMNRFPDFNTKHDVYNTYRDYINGSYEEQDEKKAKQVYDKLNRVYYKEARANNMTVPNYIMTNIISKSL